MKAVIIGIVVLVVLFFVVPMAVGGTTDVCKALVKTHVSQTASNIAGGPSGPVYGVINSVGQSFATGQGAAAVAAAKHPNVPTPISCTVRFWETL